MFGALLLAQRKACRQHYGNDKIPRTVTSVPGPGIVKESGCLSTHARSPAGAFPSSATWWLISVPLAPKLACTNTRVGEPPPFQHADAITD